jgi:heterodisulfide reductase subunit C
MLVQMVLWNDEEVLGTRTLWSDEVMTEARNACTRGINLQAVLLALREVAEQRGYTPP